mmetsp:Transcript_65641/g.186244  ORF Transcript_65641/g.186244 Transcript_65641/m.186244 type:complete len:219 (+) Transcript_65641:775-1431(+)
MVMGHEFPLEERVVVHVLLLQRVYLCRGRLLLRLRPGHDADGHTRGLLQLLLAALLPVAADLPLQLEVYEGRVIVRVAGVEPTRGDADLAPGDLVLHAAHEVNLEAELPGHDARVRVRRHRQRQVVRWLRVCGHVVQHGEPESGVLQLRLVVPHERPDQLHRLGAEGGPEDQRPELPAALRIGLPGDHGCRGRSQESKQGRKECAHCPWKVDWSRELR